jgi:glutathione S-transferase
MITVYAFRRVPEFAQGVVRDLRVRWALNEVGLPYQTQLLDGGAHKQSAYRQLQPFGQVPAYEEDDLVMFESGAIVLHIGAKSTTLLPSDPHGRARATCWVLAALNTIEVVAQQLAEIDLFYPAEAWACAHRPQVEERVRVRLGELAARLEGRDYLEERFTAGDLMMTTVLRLLRHTRLVTAHPLLGPYLARCEARPAFQRALTEQLAAFAA